MKLKTKSILISLSTLTAVGLLTLSSCSFNPLPSALQNKDQNKDKENKDQTNVAESNGEAEKNDSTKEDNELNNDKDESIKPVINSAYKEVWNIPSKNHKDYQTWNNSELKANNFSTVNTNNKLDIVPLRGADDIKDPTFSSRHINTDPLQGKLVNDKYVNLAKISYSVNFAQSGSNNIGTAWLLDYQIPKDVTIKEDGNSFTDDNYPTKWYLATNSHVMDDLKTKNSIYPVLNTKGRDNKSTTAVQFRRLKDPKKEGDWVGITSLKTTHFDIFNILLSDAKNYQAKENPAIRPVFFGFDYLKSSPKDFINNVPTLNEVPEGVDYKNTEELADFSVFEIDFEKIVKDGNFPSEANNNPHKYAKIFTNDYANWAKKDQFKPAEKSLLAQDPNEVKDKKFYVVGFPQEWILNKDETRKTSAEVALFINQPKTLEKKDYPNAGGYLTEEKKYSTFKNFPGIFDSIIGSADFGYKHQPLQSNLVASGGLVPYLFQGLMYVDNQSDMYGGSSGSIFVDENNNIYGIHFASDWTAHVGINFALKSEGYNYNGAYGIYDLQPYDLINGGYSNQKSSYKDQLRLLYNDPTIRTNIFSNGIGSAKTENK